jgi:hypothetical protein
MLLVLLPLSYNHSFRTPDIFSCWISAARYFKIVLISSIVGALSSAYLFPLGNPRPICFQGMDKSLISQNIFLVLIEFLRVPLVICFFSTLFFSDCTYPRTFEKAQLGSFFPSLAKWFHLSLSIRHTSSSRKSKKRLRRRNKAPLLLERL